MNAFSAHWLALREPLDAASRAAALATRACAEIGRSRRRDTRVQIVDLGAGTGANLRYTAPLIGGPQHWLLVEHDPLLIDAMETRMRAWSQRGARFECEFQTLALDLAVKLDELPLRDGAILTASALLDLVSEPWLRTLIGRAAQAEAVVWFTLIYDGRMDCQPAEAGDQEVRDLVNRHQRGDKGFGAALGPAAAATGEAMLLEHGYQVLSAPSDWNIGPEQPDLQRALIEGWFEAACELAPFRTTALRDWRARRRAHVDAGRSRLRVGHVDLLGRATGSEE